MNQTGDRREKKKRVGIDPFELLYIAISIATFSHTVWAASFAFEGPPPIDQGEMVLWQLKGSLIAIAIDLGMLLSARFIAKSHKVSWSMVLAFVVAAVSSFYTQLLYILYHTGAFAIGGGVGEYWKTNLEPLVAARVIILPILLPLLGIIYTLARVGREKQAATEEAVRRANAPVTVSDVLAQHARPAPIAIEGHEAQVQLPAPEGELVQDDRIAQAIKALGNAQVDLSTNRFWDAHWQNWSKPYESKEEMIKAMLTLGKRRTTMLNNRAKKHPKE